jgi:signal transduction histidine kinase
MPSRAFLGELVIATLAVLAALGLRMLLIPVLGDRLPFVTAFGGVAIVAFFCRWQISAAAAIVLFLFAGIFMTSDPVEQRIAGAMGYVFSTGLIILMSELLRRERNRSRGLADEVNEKRAQLENFMAVVAHELRTPLAAMQNAAAILADPRPSEELVRATVPILDRQSSHMRRLVDDLVDIARVQRGELRLEKQPVSVGAVIDEAIEMCRSYLAQKEQTLACTTGAGDWTVLGDRVRLVQMVCNLVHNATKFSPRKTEIGINAARSNGTVDIVVRDQGYGLSQQVLDGLFKPFGTRQDAGSFSETGLGIGLTIVAHLAELHGGEVMAQNRADAKGAEFSIRLPLYQAAP